MDVAGAERAGPQSSSVRRALAILEFLRESSRHRSLSEISRRLSLPKSSTSLLLGTLESTGYIIREGEERRYKLTSKALQLGLSLHDNLDLARRSQEMLEIIADRLKVTAHVTCLDGEQVLYVSKADGVAQPCVDIYAGRRTDLHCTAVGKILLSGLNPADLRAFLARRKATRYTSRTIMEPEKLSAEILSVRGRGYSFSDQEQFLGVRCLAVGIHNQGRPVAALGITGGLSDISLNQLGETITYLARMSSKILAGTEAV